MITKKGTYIIVAAAFIMLAAAHRTEAAANRTTLNNQILCGYQGWFAYPGDGGISKWKHWFHNQTPTAANLAVDLYPYTGDYNSSDLKDSSIPLQGGYAKFYSTSHVNIVKKHFQWMQNYGITGVFHMRFMQDIDIPANYNWKTGVLQNVRTAAEAYGRAFAVSYNIAGCDNSVLDDLKADWINLVDNEQITSSSSYLKHNNKPVLRIYGIGFLTVNVTDTTKMQNLINWLKTDAPEQYRVTIVGGIPSGWRTLNGDSRSGTAWKNIYDSLEVIHPWHVNRWTTEAEFDTYYNGRIKLDAQYCENLGILYMPTMWPGFSWRNLKYQTKPLNQVPRDKGNFMWRQAYKYCGDSNIDCIWMAQMDEVDEGTAIFKIAKNDSEAPDQGDWVTLASDGYVLPRDWYMRLCGQAQKMLRGFINLTPNIPITP